NEDRHLSTPTAPAAPAALVTGASRGIGRGIALAIAKLGWRVGVNFSSNQSAAEETVAQIRAAGSEAHAIQGDVANAAQRKFMLESMTKHFGRIDALINNAGVAPESRDDLLEATETAFDRVLNINLKGPYFLSQLAANQMISHIKSGALSRGYIINISSVS